MGLFVFAGTWLLVVTLLVAGVGKFRAPSTFRASLTSSSIPQGLVAPLAVLLPVGEVAVAVGLVLPPTSRAASWLALALMLGFTVFAAVVVVRGLDVTCACFGDAEPAPMSWRTVVRNSALSAVAGLVALGRPSAEVLWEPPRVTDGELRGAVAAVLVLLVVQAVWLSRLQSRYAAVTARLDEVATSRTEVASASNPAYLAVSLVDAQERTTSLRDHLRSGQQLVVVWLLPSCRGCRALVPEVREWYRRAAGRFSLVVLTDEHAPLDPVLADPLLPPVLLQRRRQVSSSVALRRTPSAVLLAADGAVVGAPASGTAAVRALVEAMLPAMAENEAPAVAGDGESRRSPVEAAVRGDALVMSGGPSNGKTLPSSPRAGDLPLGNGKVGPAAEGVTTVDVDGDLSIYSPVTGRVLSLNRTASDVWLLCDGEYTMRDLVSLLATSYGTDADTIRDHVHDTVTMFREEGLLGRADEPVRN